MPNNSVSGIILDKRKADNNLNGELTQRNKSIFKEREESHKKIIIQATKMLCESNKIFALLKKDTNVLIRVPDVDRGRLTPRNILAIVSGIIDDDLYELSTEND
nr:unnamed protein product [Callosobruchus analis]